MTLRRCSHCNTDKPLGEFDIKKRKKRDGSISIRRQAWCIPCTRAYTLGYARGSRDTKGTLQP